MEAKHKEFMLLVNANERIIYEMCHRYNGNPEDIMDTYQNIVENAWKSFNSFRNESKFSTWLHSVSRNTAIHGLRKDIAKRKTITELMPYEQQLLLIPDTHYDILIDEKLNQLREFIDRMNTVDRSLITLYLEQKSYEEMEEILGINQNTMRVRMGRIKGRLRKLFLKQ